MDTNEYSYIFDNENMNQPVLFSTGGDGGDVAWASEAIKKHHRIVHLLNYAEKIGEDIVVSRQKKFIKYLPYQSDIISNERFLELLRLRNIDTTKNSINYWKSAIKNIFLAENISTLYVVSSRVATTSIDVDIIEPLGIAVQAYVEHMNRINSPCNLYFYDDTSEGVSGMQIYTETNKKWNQWNMNIKKWIPMSGNPPCPDGSYGAIGNSRLNVSGLNAIKKLFDTVPVYRGQTSDNQDIILCNEPTRKSICNIH